MFIYVCNSTDVPPDGKPVIKLVGGRFPLAVARVDGRVVAFSAFCPHSKWNLGASGYCFMGRDGDVKVLCKGHGGVWSVRSGEGYVQGKPSNRLEVYSAVEREGKIFVDVPENAARLIYGSI